MKIVCELTRYGRRARGKDPEVETIRHEYELPDQRDALHAFFDDVPMDPTKDWGNVRCYQPGEGEPPTRRLKNWEQNPDAEVEDGYLTNFAADYANERAMLEWQPEYCTKVGGMMTICPCCGDTMHELEGQYGTFYKCPACGEKFSFGTRKWKAATKPTFFCGTRKTTFINQHGVPYPGCPSCHPQGDYERRPIRELIGASV